MFTVIGQATVLSSSLKPELSSSKPDTINIGFILSGENHLSAKHAAQLAIQNANNKVDKRNQYLNLIVRSANGPWGAGSNELVKMVHNDEVSAIIGSLDSRNAHLAEQVAAKTHVVFLSTWAIDPSLSQAFVPWYFRCIPNAQQQAKTLANAIYKSSEKEIVGIVSDNSYENSFILNCFKKEAYLLSEPQALTFNLVNFSQQNIVELLNQISKSEVKKLVFFTSQETAQLVLEGIKSQDLNFDIYGTIALVGNIVTNQFFKAEANGVKDYLSSPIGKSFLRKFEDTYGYRPDAKAAYAFDGMNVIIAAMRNSEQDREKLREAVSAIQFEGVTGMIHFDEKGNRLGGAELIQIENGIPLRNVK